MVYFPHSIFHTTDLLNYKHLRLGRSSHIVHRESSLPFFRMAVGFAPSNSSLMSVLELLSVEQSGLMCKHWPRVSEVIHQVVGLIVVVVDSGSLPSVSGTLSLTLRLSVVAVESGSLSLCLRQPLRTQPMTPPKRKGIGQVPRMIRPSIEIAVTIGMAQLRAKSCVTQKAQDLEPILQQYAHTSEGVRLGPGFFS